MHAGRFHTEQNLRSIDDDSRAFDPKLIEHQMLFSR